VRRIKVFDRVSADGYFADAKGGLDWVVPDDEVDADAGSSLGDHDAMLFGRKTYEMFEAFWPKAVENPKLLPHGGGKEQSSAVRAMAEWINDSEKVVFSKTLKHVTWKNTRLEPTFRARDVRAMKQAPGGGILVFGSGSIVSELVRHDLVDEIHLIVCPVVLGGGRSFLTEASKHQLALVEAKPFSSGNVVLRYTCEPR
jgi:dihydrofolate reductase